MTRSFRIPIAGLALLFGLILGLSEVVHAQSKACSGGPCDPANTLTVGLDHDATAHPDPVRPQGGDDGCDPSLCHVVALAVAPVTLLQTVEFLSYLAESPPLRDLLTPEKQDRPPRL